MIPKPKRETSKKYLEYIKTLPCIALGSHVCVGDIVPHHSVTRGAGGSDYLTVPVCYAAHQTIHNLGRVRFESASGVSIDDEIRKNLIGYIKRLEGE